MEHYEVLFACKVHDGTVVPHMRIISAPDKTDALSQAYAMVGEKIGAHRLDCMVYAIRVDLQQAPWLDQGPARARSFELRFQTAFDDGYTAGSGGQHCRIIATNTLGLACRIGLAMAGELVGESLWLERLESVRETEAAVRVPTLDNTTTWKRVFSRLNVQPGQTRLFYSFNIGLSQNPRGHQKVAQSADAEIVGFIPWPEARNTHGTP